MRKFSENITIRIYKSMVWKIRWNHPIKKTAIYDKVEYILPLFGREHEETHSYHIDFLN